MLIPFNTKENGKKSVFTIRIVAETIFMKFRFNLMLLLYSQIRQITVKNISIGHKFIFELCYPFT